MYTEVSPTVSCMVFNLNNNNLRKKLKKEDKKKVFYCWKKSFSALVFQEELGDVAQLTATAELSFWSGEF